MNPTSSRAVVVGAVVAGLACAHARDELGVHAGSAVACLAVTPVPGRMLAGRP